LTDKRTYSTLPFGTKASKAEAMKRYPAPVFVDRPTGREDRGSLEVALLQRIDALWDILNGLEALARRQHVGSKLPKRVLTSHINMLHDWHRQYGGYYSMPTPGSPILWED